MRIAGRSGHNPLAKGAVGIVDETTEDRKIFLASKKYLQEVGNEFIECYPRNMNGISTELMWGINKANNSGASLFYSVHLNKAYNSYNGAIGSEIWLHPVASQDTKNKANAILNNLKNLGFINRGIKYSKELAELNSTSMEAMIIECFFCEATKDVELYKKYGPDELGFAIAHGIDSRVKENNTTPSSNKKYRNLIIYANDVDMRAALYLADYFNMVNEDGKAIHVKEYKEGMGTSIWAVGGGLDNIKADVRLKGKNRFDTLAVLCRKINILY